MSKFIKSVRRFLPAGLVTVALASKALAVDVLPDAASMTTSMTSIAGVGAAAATVGFSIWLYRKVKAKAGQAIG